MKGVGEEISFDEEISGRYGCVVHAYDAGPHPKVEERHRDNPRVVIHRKHVSPDRRPEGGREKLELINI